MILFIMTDILLVGYGAYGLVKYYIIDYGADQELAYALQQNLIDYPTFHAYNRPQDLQITGTSLISRPAVKVGPAAPRNQYDFLAKIQNPNERWRADISYTFGYFDDEEWKQAFILPQEERLVFELGVGLEGSASNFNFIIRDIKWQKLDPRLVPDYSVFAGERLNFEIKDLRYNTAGQLGTSGFNQAAFSITNNSIYNYRDLGLLAVLWQGNKIVGVNYLVIERLMSERTEKVEMYFFERLPSVNRVEVLPYVDIFDKSVYIEYEQVAGEEK